jgi:hypothetical protein
MAKPSNGTRLVTTGQRPNAIREMLQALPVDKRAEAIVEIFRVIASEFAAMVLEHVKPVPPAKRKSARGAKRRSY